MHKAIASLGNRNAAIAFLQLCRKHLKIEMPLPDAISHNLIVTFLLTRLLERAHSIGVS
ncbi:hypothetical protein [Gloeocapsopsis dulcis]|uniref:hypothetical protein n=1 Tax=Gloeocapsopsis dulcis TaxID=2859516 RepID=UPI0030D6D840